MKHFLLLICAILVIPKAVADSSHECDLAKIDAGRTMILLYFENCSLVAGANSPMAVGNGLTNDPRGPQTYLWLARDAAEVDSSQHLLSVALTAVATDRRLVVRWKEDNNLKVIDYMQIN